jgi:hypothetical protein
MSTETSMDRALRLAAESPDKVVTVCDHCLRAACWQGHFFCDNYKGAGTVEKTVSELVKLRLEHPGYWE